MEKISITKLEKDFNSNNDFNVEEVIDLSNTKNIRKLFSNYSNYNDLVKESDKKIEKDKNYVDSLSNVEKFAQELEIKYLDKDNKVIDESNIAGKIAIREKKLKSLEEEIALIKEDGNEPSETKINNKKDLEAELAKLRNQKLVFENNVKFQQKEISDVNGRIEEEKAKKEKNSYKAKEIYFKIYKLTELCSNEIKAARKELSKANKALKSFENKNTEDFTKLTIEEQKDYSKKIFELHTNVITAGEILQNKRDKYLKVLATISSYIEDYPELKANIDPIITKLDSDSKKAMKDMDIVEVIEIEEPIIENDKKEEKVEDKEENIIDEEKVESEKAEEEKTEETEKEKQSEEKTEEEKVEETEKEEQSEEKTEEVKEEPKTNLARAMESEKGKKITDVPPRKFFKTTELPKINEMPEREDSMSISEYMSKWASRIDKGEAEPAFIDESRIDEKHSWMNADQARATGNLNSIKEENEKSAIDKLIEKIKSLNESPIVDTKEETSETPVVEETKAEEPVKPAVEETKVEEPVKPVVEETKVEEPVSSYTEFNKIEKDDFIDPATESNENSTSSYTEFNSPSENTEFIDSSEDKVDMVDDNTEYVLDDSFNDTPDVKQESLPARVIVNIKEAPAKLLDKVKDSIAKYFLNAETYQLYQAQKNNDAVVKVKE